MGTQQQTSIQKSLASEGILTFGWGDKKINMLTLCCLCLLLHFSLYFAHCSLFFFVIYHTIQRYVYLIDHFKGLFLVLFTAFFQYACRERGFYFIASAFSLTSIFLLVSWLLLLVFPASSMTSS